MSAKPKFPRATALAVAKEICEILEPFCKRDRLLVAGSRMRYTGPWSSRNGVCRGRNENSLNSCEQTMEKQNVKPTIWMDCYKSGWKGLITPASFAHPAKFSRDLIQSIFAQALM